MKLTLGRSLLSTYKHQRSTDRAQETKRLFWFLASQISATYDQQEAVKS